MGNQQKICEKILSCQLGNLGNIPFNQDVPRSLFYCKQEILTGSVAKKKKVYCRRRIDKRVKRIIEGVPV